MFLIAASIAITTRVMGRVMDKVRVTSAVELYVEN